ncbi:hypothetical protein BDV40DRAFT_258073 [Aspergillus tamarii]|uniref:Uncharacterized protein n=1 Tax=Aspergillus tamarii TaxID=41984 RepID=A0A5N6V4I0_ASPTM|nr:hypothetical protein BDV40DRAFT_258073 [Aspergillus tamarii]
MFVARTPSKRHSIRSICIPFCLVSLFLFLISNARHGAAIDPCDYHRGRTKS